MCSPEETILAEDKGLCLIIINDFTTCMKTSVNSGKEIKLSLEIVSFLSHNLGMDTN
jgi:hypothetical protein